MAAIGRYVAWRLPTLITEAMPIAALVGASLTFLRLAGGLEMTAMRAGGLSLPQVTAALIPACLLLAALQFGLQGEVAPRSERSLSEWWQRTMPRAEEAPPARLWLRNHDEIVAIERVSLDGRELHGMLIVQRAASGDLIARLDARTARYADKRWVLHDVRIVRTSRPGAETRLALDWPDGPSPANMVELAWPVGPQTLERLVATLRERWAGGRGPLFYWTALDQLLVTLLDPLLMVLLATPLLMGLPRSGQNGLEALKVMVLGLSYLGVSGLLSAMGATGAVPPIVAASAPMLLFSAYGLVRMLQIDTT